jgi:transposase
MDEVHPSRRVFLDESGAKTNMTRRYGRAPRGARVIEHAPAGHWCTTTMLCALRHDRVEAPLVIDGAMDSLVFRGYVERMLAPTLQPGDMVVMDNLSPHKTRGVQEAIEARGATVRYLPPYSPDFNPIESMWAKVKQHLCSTAARTHPRLVRAVGDALRSVTPDDCRGFFRGYGYAGTQ